MSTKTCNFNKESICATCLSQDRKLIAMRDSRVCVLSYFELSLKLNDRICWECHNFMRRMVAFKSRVQKAQAWLWQMTNGQQHELHSLSTLTKSKGIYVDVCPPTTGTDPHLLPDIKPEPIEKYTIKEEVTAEDPLTHNVTYPGPNLGYITPDNRSASYQKQNHVRTPVEQWPHIIVTPLIKPADAALNDGNGDSDDLDGGHEGGTDDKASVGMSIFLHNKAAKPVGNTNGYRGYSQRLEGDEDDDEATTKDEDFEDLLPASCSLVGTKRESQHEPKEWFKTKKDGKRTAAEPQTLGRPDFVYIKKVMTEEELMQWRKEKPTSEYYSRSIPTERCEKCIDVFDQERLTRAHALKHSEVYGELVCYICEQRAADAKAMMLHKNWHYRLLKCRYCPFIWDNVNTMRHHCNEIHNVPQVAWDCDLCERQFPSMKLFRAHDRSHRLARCPHCDHFFAKANIKNHILQHAGGVPLMSCAECGGHYRGEGGLRIHMLTHRTESDETAYCAECNVQYKNRFTYRAHLRSRKHASKEEYRFECNECGKKFLNITAIRFHMEVHMDTQYPCQQCKRVFNTRNARQNHVNLVHEGKARRQHICDHCGRIFNSRGLLAQHINSHTGARPYACKICGSTFGYKSALYLHARFKHKIQKKTKKNASSKVNK